MNYPPLNLDDYLGDEAPILPDLFLPMDEALRWLAEQEYVIGTVLLVCSYAEHQLVSPAKSDGSSTGNSPNTASSVVREKRRSAVPSNSHPMKYAASYVLTAFPQWGNVDAFCQMWSAQVRIVTQVACEERQMECTVLHPHNGDPVTFSSTMECGNLTRVCAVSINSTAVYQLWVIADPNAEKKLWFRFSVTGCAEGVPLCLRIMNLSAHEKLYLQNDMKPSWMAYPVHPNWRCVQDAKFNLTSDNAGQLSFYVMPPKGSKELHFAYCVPYGYGDLLCYISRWHATVRQRPSNVRFEERVLTRTWDQRKLHLLIISSQAEGCPWSNGHGSAKFRRNTGHPPFTDFSTGKKVVLLSGRVHPGEVTASHALHGIITFLLSNDPKAELLREYFIFFVVPMLNPDGVARGHTRRDQKGNNLNDCYKEPIGTAPPTVGALKTVFSHLQSHFGPRFIAYMDFHSHVSKDKSFSFGNYLQSTVQCWNTLYAKLVELHCPHLFDYNTCRFGLECMNAKEGSARVQFGESLIHSYTVELTPFTSGELDPADDKPCVLKGSAEVGRACVLALLDYCCLQPSSDALESMDGGWDGLYREMRRQSRTSTVGGRAVKGLR